MHGCGLQLNRQKQVKTQIQLLPMKMYVYV